MSQLVNLLTILSLFCGFLSLLLSLAGKFTFSAYAIIFSVILDGFDGQIARSSRVFSAFGRELDSLVDVVSFGIAPALLAYSLLYDEFSLFIIAALFIYLLCAVIRLAKYNISTQVPQQCYFNGLPTTVSGGMLASLVLVYRKEGMYFKFINVLFVLVILLLAFLMVSRARYLNLDGLKKVSGRMLRPLLLSLFIVLCGALFFDKVGATLFSIFLIYLIFSPFVVKRLNSNKGMISPR